MRRMTLHRTCTMMVTCESFQDGETTKTEGEGEGEGEKRVEDAMAVMTRRKVGNGKAAERAVAAAPATAPVVPEAKANDSGMKKQNVFARWILLFSCVIGIYVSYLTQGLLQEQL